MGKVIFGGSIFERKASTAPVEVVTMDFDGFAEWLRAKHARRLSRKEQANLFSPSLFDPALSSYTKRGLKNVTRVFANILLDNDTGAFSIEQFAALFPTLKFVACNTFNTTVAVPKYRLIIAADRVMTAEVYGLIAR